MPNQAPTPSQTLGGGQRPASAPSPARSALAAHLASLRESAAAVAALEGPRQRLADAATAEAEAQADLDEIAKREAEAITTWAQTGEGQMPEPQLAARKRAGDKLVRAKALAQAAQAGLGDLNARLQDAAQQHREIASRTRAIVNSVLIEEAETIAATLDATLLRGGALMARLAALHEHFGAQHDLNDASTYKPGETLRALMPPASVAATLLHRIPVADVDAYLAEWKDLARDLARDPDATTAPGASSRRGPN